MVTIQVKNIEGKTVLPIAGSTLAAGYDIVAIDDPIIVGEEVVKEGEFFPFYRRIDYIEYHTALYISPQADTQYTHHARETFHTLLHPRSSVRKYNMILANSIGLVDNDYRGEIILCFKYIWQPEDYVFEYVNSPVADGANGTIPVTSGKLLGKLNREKIYKKGDKIGQLVAEKTNPIEFRLVSELDATERGDGGFGSTDVKESTAEGALKAFETIINHPAMNNIIKLTAPTTPVETPTPLASEQPKGAYGDIVERYQKAGGIPVRKKYSDEIKERDQGK